MWLNMMSNAHNEIIHGNFGKYENLG